MIVTNNNFFDFKAQELTSNSTLDSGQNLKKTLASPEVKTGSGLASPKSEKAKLASPVTEIIKNQADVEISLQDRLEANTNQVALNSSAVKTNDYVKMLLLTTGTTASDLTLTPRIQNFIVNQLGICLGNFIPLTGVNYLASYVVNPLVRLNKTIGNLFGSNVTSDIFIPALCEEIEFRWFVQGILLKKLPEKVIKKISPDLAWVVDSAPAKISRVAATALFFAICHLHVLDCEKGGGISQFAGGLLYGALYELSDQNLVHCINLHCLHNLALRLF